MPLTATVEVNGKGQIRRRLVFVDVLRQQDGVGAQIHDLLAGDDAGHDLRHFLVDQRLTAGDGHHRCAALIHRAQRLLDAQPPLQNLLRIIDFAAARASQVALEQRLQHQHQRIPLHTPQLTARNIPAHPVRLNQWNAQTITPIAERKARRGDRAISAPTP